MGPRPRSQRRSRFKRFRAAVFVGIAVLVGWAAVHAIASVRRSSPVVTLQGAHVIYYLTPRTFGTYAGACTGSGLASFGVTPDAIVLKVGARLLALRRHDDGTWDQTLEPSLLADGLHEPDDVTADESGAILIVDRDGGRLRQLASGGVAQDVGDVHAVPGPYGVAASWMTGGAFLYGSRHIFALDDSRGSASLRARFDESVVESVADAPDGPYVVLRRPDSHEHEIVQLQGDTPQAIIRLPVIQSLAAPEDRRILFLSTDDTVFALVGTTAIPVTRNLAGRLRWRNGVLFILDCRGWFVGIEHLPAALGLTGGAK
jgi:hypothetical protein